MHSLSVRKRTENQSNRTLRSSNLICLVCGAPATGFNFSVITCMCCKAFFRRNALFGLESYQCRYVTETCTINILTRRDCSYCRLKKCFQVGMKKELILTDDIKQLKRERIHANRQMTLSQEKSFVNCNIILDELKTIFNSYEEYCRLPIRTCEKREYELTIHQPLKTRMKFQHYIEIYQVHRSSLYMFFRHIPEFQQFSIDEQKALLSHHLRFLMRINSIETMDDSFPLWGPIRFLLETMYGTSLIETFDTRFRQFRFYINDSQCTQLFLVILLFSTSINYFGKLNTLVIYQIQEKYTQIFWKYLNQCYGEQIAYKKFTFIICQCLYIQTLQQTLENRREEIQQQNSIIHQIDQL